MQDFAAAAQEKWTPSDSLKAPAAFWNTLAQRNREHEQDPDPTACGVDTLRFAYWYLWRAADAEKAAANCRRGRPQLSGA